MSALTANRRRHRGQTNDDFKTSIRLQLEVGSKANTSGNMRVYRAQNIHTHIQINRDIHTHRHTDIAVMGALLFAK